MLQESFVSDLHQIAVAAGGTVQIAATHSRRRNYTLLNDRYFHAAACGPARTQFTEAGLMPGRCGPRQISQPLANFGYVPKFGGAVKELPASVGVGFPQDGLVVRAHIVAPRTGPSG